MVLSIDTIHGVTGLDLEGEGLALQELSKFPIFPSWCLFHHLVEKESSIKVVSSPLLLVLVTDGGASSILLLLSHTPPRATIFNF